MDNKRSEMSGSTSHRPSNRQSRLVQPRKYSATPIGKRSLSTENHILAKSDTAARMARSRSVCLETPRRTTMRVLDWTPATSQKCTTQQVNRVLMFLRRNISSNYLSGGLRSMSAKQLLEIIVYFGRVVCGSKFKIAENSVDEVMKFLEMVQYPHRLTKSWFKTPTADHAFDRIVELLDWLCDFVGDVQAESDDSKWFESRNWLIDTKNCFPNDNFNETFVVGASKYFMSWSDQNPEFDQYKTQLIDLFILKKTNETNIDVKIAMEESELCKLMKTRTSLKTDSQLEKEEKIYEELDNKLADVRGTIEDMKTELADVQDALKRAKESKVKQTELIQSMRQTIENQIYSTHDRQLLAGELSLKTITANEKRMMLDKLQNDVVDQQVAVARCKSNKTKKNLAFNNLIENLFHDNVDFDGITKDQLLLEENMNQHSIKHVLELLSKIKKDRCNRQIAVDKLIKNSETIIEQHETELYKIKAAIIIEEKTIRGLQAKIQVVLNNIADTEYEHQQKCKQKQSKIDNLRDECEPINTKLELMKEQCVRLADDNERKLQEIELKAESILRKKKERALRIMESLSIFEDALERAKVLQKMIKKNSH